MRRGRGEVAQSGFGDDLGDSVGKEGQRRRDVRYNVGDTLKNVEIWARLCATAPDDPSQSEQTVDPQRARATNRAPSTHPPTGQNQCALYSY